MEVVPLVMQSIRAEMRAGRGHDLSVPAFRALGYVRRHPGSSLSALADHIGLTRPSASKLVDGLVSRKLVVRRIYVGDRRRMTLELSARGRELLNTAHNSALQAMAKDLAGLDEQQRSDVIRAMEILNPIFAGTRTKDTTLAAAVRMGRGQNGRRAAVR
jgi:DNA-binding MarR family transcriptional regulator